MLREIAVLRLLRGRRRFPDNPPERRDRNAVMHRPL
jgi:hypothetical protein